MKRKRSTSYHKAKKQKKKKKEEEWILAFKKKNEDELEEEAMAIFRLSHTSIREKKLNQILLILYEKIHKVGLLLQLLKKTNRNRCHPLLWKDPTNLINTVRLDMFYETHFASLCNTYFNFGIHLAQNKKEVIPRALNEIKKATCKSYPMDLGSFGYSEWYQEYKIKQTFLYLDTEFRTSSLQAWISLLFLTGDMDCKDLGKIYYFAVHEENQMFLIPRIPTDHRRFATLPVKIEIDQYQNKTSLEVENGLMKDLAFFWSIESQRKLQQNNNVLLEPLGSLIEWKSTDVLQIYTDLFADIFGNFSFLPYSLWELIFSYWLLALSQEEQIQSLHYDDEVYYVFS